MERSILLGWIEVFRSSLVVGTIVLGLAGLLSAVVSCLVFSVNALGSPVKVRQLVR